jgi:hypothetical protein
MSQSPDLICDTISLDNSKDLDLDHTSSIVPTELGLIIEYFEHESGKIVMNESNWKICL